jgi:hypothetical protein
MGDLGGGPEVGEERRGDALEIVEPRGGDAWGLRVEPGVDGGAERAAVVD